MTLPLAVPLQNLLKTAIHDTHLTNHFLGFGELDSAAQRQDQGPRSSLGGSDGEGGPAHRPEGGRPPAHAWAGSSGTPNGLGHGEHSWPGNTGSTNATPSRRTSAASNSSGALTVTASVGRKSHRRPGARPADGEPPLTNAKVPPHGPAPHNHPLRSRRSPLPAARLPTTPAAPPTHSPHLPPPPPPLAVAKPRLLLRPLLLDGRRERDLSAMLCVAPRPRARAAYQRRQRREPPRRASATHAHPHDSVVGRAQLR